MPALTLASFQAKLPGMQCANCGFARPGAQAACPSCGRVFVKASPLAPAQSAPLIGRGLIRCAVYGSICLGLWHYTAPLCFAYVDAEQERVESLLLRQNLERKQALRAAEQGLD